MTHNDTHLFIDDGNSSIFVMDENMQMMEELPIVDQDG